MNACEHCGTDLATSAITDVHMIADEGKPLIRISREHGTMHLHDLVVAPASYRAVVMQEAKKRRKRKQGWRFKVADAVVNFCNRGSRR